MTRGFCPRGRNGAVSGPVKLKSNSTGIFCWAFQCSRSVGYPDSLCGTVCGVSSGWRYADPFGCHQAEGAVYFEETFIHMFDSVTTIGLLLTLVMIFSFQGNTILEKPLHIVLIAVPLILQCLCSISCCGFSHDDFSGLGRACRPRNGLNWMVLVSPPERTGKDYDQHAPSTVYPSFAAERGIRRVDRAENTCQRADGA